MSVHFGEELNMKNKTKINNTHTETLGITEEIISTKQDIRLYYALFFDGSFFKYYSDGR